MPNPSVFSVIPLSVKVYKYRIYSLVTCYLKSNPQGSFRNIGEDASRSSRSNDLSSMSCYIVLSTLKYSLHR